MAGCCVLLQCGGAAALEECPVSADTIEAVTVALLCTIEKLSDYRAQSRPIPEVVLVPQPELEAKVCDVPCDVTAAYIPRQGIFLAGNLDPLRNVVDRSALLHELVHHLQQGHPKFAALSGCARERAKEEEAYALQNAYLALKKSATRVRFYDGEFDCASSGTAAPN